MNDQFYKIQKSFMKAFKIWILADNEVLLLVDVILLQRNWNLESSIGKNMMAMKMLPVKLSVFIPLIS